MAAGISLSFGVAGRHCHEAGQIQCFIVYRNEVDLVPLACEDRWGLIWVQTVCKGYQQKTVNGNKIVLGFDRALQFSEGNFKKCQRISQFSFIP